MFYNRNDPFDKMVSVKLSNEDLKKFDKMAASLNTTRAKLLRVLIAAAIKDSEKDDDDEMNFS